MLVAQITGLVTGWVAAIYAKVKGNDAALVIALIGFTVAIVGGFC